MIPADPARVPGPAGPASRPQDGSHDEPLIRRKPGCTHTTLAMKILYSDERGVPKIGPAFTEERAIMRLMLALVVLCGSLASARPTHAQGFWIGGPGFAGLGFGSFGFGGLGSNWMGSGGFAFPPYGFSPYGFGNAPYFGGGYPAAMFAYPVAMRPIYVPRPVSVARPILYGSIAPAPLFVPRPAVRVPLNRAYRRVWRRGW